MFSLALRRSPLLAAVAAVALLLALGAAVSAAAAPVPGGSLDPTTIAKYADPLVIPPAMPETSSNYYEIAMRQFQQQILPAPFGSTVVWSYGSVTHPQTFNYPAFTIEAQVDTPTRVKWINGLVDENNGFLPHLLPVDQTLHWANPAAGTGHTDSHGMDPLPYEGPVPMVTHVHGSHVSPESDGYPEAWWLPAAKNIPAGYATRGSHWDQVAGVPTEDGAATFEYSNDQAAATLWYHDHTLGMTRVNVYAGPAGFYDLRGGPNDLPAGVLPGPAPMRGDAPGTKYYEMPIAIQDRSFNADGSLFYPADRAFFEGLAPEQLQIPFTPAEVEYDGVSVGVSDVAPIWNPEFFGNTMVVNGKTWPYLEVEPRRYRFRLLDGCDARFLMLKTDKPVPIWQIGAEGGFLPAPTKLDTIQMSPAERADVIVDFSGYQPGDVITLLNEGPDEPFQGGEPGADFDAADPDTTGQVMQFKVVSLTSPDTSADPATLELPSPQPLGSATVIRKVSLNEMESETVRVTMDGGGNVVLDKNGDAFGPTMALLGTLDADGVGVPLLWSAPITETPTQGDTEIWEIYNFTADAHPIHPHQVQFQVVDRRAMNGGAIRPPEAREMGFKDTVTAYPGEVTRVKAMFDIPGLYVWHCHIIEHEDNEMMRPYEVSKALLTVSFPDVPPTSQFAVAIDYLAARQIVAGYDNGMFGPYNPVLRAQLSKMVMLGSGKHTTNTNNLGNPTFPDVAYTGAPYPFDFVEETADLGYVQGYTSGRFGPYDVLTRIQLLRILDRALGDKLADPPAGYESGFTDVAPEDVALVAKMKWNGVIQGKTPTTFDPYGTATRGQVSQVLYEMLTK